MKKDIYKEVSSLLESIATDRYDDWDKDKFKKINTVIENMCIKISSDVEDMFDEIDSGIPSLLDDPDRVRVIRTRLIEAAKDSFTKTTDILNLVKTCSDGVDVNGLKLYNSCVKTLKLLMADILLENGIEIDDHTKLSSAYKMIVRKEISLPIQYMRELVRDLITFRDPFRVAERNKDNLCELDEIVSTLYYVLSYRISSLLSKSEFMKIPTEEEVKNIKTEFCYKDNLRYAVKSAKLFSDCYDKRQKLISEYALETGSSKQAILAMKGKISSINKMYGEVCEKGLRRLLMLEGCWKAVKEALELGLSYILKENGYVFGSEVTSFVMVGACEDYKIDLPVDELSKVARMVDKVCNMLETGKEVPQDLYDNTKQVVDSVNLLYLYINEKFG